ncbi:conserved hypothetical protein [Ricinus communis]|uniref:Uncharacterized protein n=1 Tax=Ricinus communis TaxID=3988 RepID=B9S2Z3_RICCO|nr:conserved hypothetical protein [Ricinus communis]
MQQTQQAPPSATDTSCSLYACPVMDSTISYMTIDGQISTYTPLSLDTVPH